MVDYVLSVVITFHNENTLAYLTLKSVMAGIRCAEASNVTCELVTVLDRATPETVRIINEFAYEATPRKVVTVDHGDLGLSRNSGISAASGTFVAICDGDDYYSQNWFLEGTRFLQNISPRLRSITVLHPEYCVSFGAQYCFNRQVGHDESRPMVGLFSDNWWTSWTLGHRSIYVAVPYLQNQISLHGVGYEDWSWNCNTIFSGMIHDIVPRTCGYYRRKSSGLLALSSATHTLPHFTRLFTRSYLVSET